MENRGVVHPVYAIRYIKPVRLSHNQLVKTCNWFVIFLNGL